MVSNQHIVLLEHTPNPEKVVATAAKLCYSPSDIDSLRELIDTKDQKKFIEKLVGMGHESPLEHISFTFGIEGISRACSHQLVRHRIASYSQQSQRYVKEEEFDYIMPESLEPYKDKFKGLMFDTQMFYSELLQAGIPAEDARFVLPNATETKIIVTMNARSLLHFFNQRCCNRAQWEIRQMAISMLILVRKVAPTIFNVHSGPRCLSGPCPEGSYSCGKAKDVRWEFSQLK